MDTYSAIVARIREGDLADGTISAALDCHQETFGLSLANAVCDVCRSITLHQESVNLAVAVKLVNGRGPRAVHAQREIVIEAQGHTNDPHDIHVIGGSSEPTLVFLPTRRRSRSGRTTMILVGAEWVLHKLLPRIYPDGLPDD